MHRNLECQVHESRQIGSGQTGDGKSERHSVMSNSLRPQDCNPPNSSVHGGSPGKNTGLGCHIAPLLTSRCGFSIVPGHGVSFSGGFQSVGGFSTASCDFGALEGKGCTRPSTPPS